MTNKINLNDFDFSQFQKEAIDKLKSGQSLTGKEGVLTPGSARPKPAWPGVEWINI